MNREADDDADVDVQSEASTVAAALEVIAAGLLAPVPALRVDELRERCFSLDPPPWSLAGEADWTDGVLLSSTQRSLSRTTETVDELATRLRDCAGLPVRSPEARRVAGWLASVQLFVEWAQGELRDAVTIIGLPMGLLPVPGYDPDRDAVARPPSVRQLRLMAQRGLEVGGHGTRTYAELAAHFSWRCPDGSGWPTPHPDAPFLHSRLLREIYEVYSRERSSADPDPGLVKWLAVVIAGPCSSCRAGAGEQCVTSSGWRREAHLSHKSRLREARRTLGFRKPAPAVGSSEPAG